MDKPGTGVATADGGVREQDVVGLAAALAERSLDGLVPSHLQVVVRIIG